ncbi:MAG: hypothetical protein HZB44_04610 [Actinobacteria bacterium]|nr:hypothetical protein [Actinomycetota bacterium]
MLPSSLTPIRAFAEIKFPTSFIFIDKLGAIADYASTLYSEKIQITDFIAAGSEDDNALLKASENSIWVAKKTNTRDEQIDLDSFIPWASDQFIHLAELINIEEYFNIGLRVYYLQEYSKVEEAVETFKERLVNYSQAPFNVVLGKPTKCILEFGVREDSINKNFKLTCIHDEREDAPKGSGGILLDLDINREGRENMFPIKDCNSTYEELKKISFETIRLFSKALNDESSKETKKVAG